MKSETRLEEHHTMLIASVYFHLYECFPTPGNYLAKVHDARFASVIRE